MQTVVALYSKTDAIVQPWVRAGFHAVLVDLQHAEGEHTDGDVTRIGADMLDWVPPLWLARTSVRMVFAFPPCDHLAVSGARWFAGKGLGKLAHSIRLFDRAAFWCEWFGAPYMIENPVSTISSYWRKPDHTFHPWQYTAYEASDNYTKKTCLWTGNGFVMPKPKADCATVDDRIHKAPPSADRANFRSATPLGFSRAVFEANHKLAMAAAPDLYAALKAYVEADDNTGNPAMSICEYDKNMERARTAAIAALSRASRGERT